MIEFKEILASYSHKRILAIRPRRISKRLISYNYYRVNRDFLLILGVFYRAKDIVVLKNTRS